MPKTDIDYSNTIIYKITCKDPDIKDVYVGHTTNFVQRKHAHKQSCTNMKSSNYSCKLYEVIRNNGGWNNWTMEIVGFFNCKDHYEARIKEQEYFELLNATLNSIEPMPKPKQKPKQIMKLKMNKYKPINKIIYNCEICKIKFQNLKSMEKHNQCNKHIKKQKQILEQSNRASYRENIIDNSITNYCELGQNVSKLENGINPKYVCEKCEYKTDNKKDYSKHLLTNKHLRQMLENPIKPPKYICETCEYNTDNKKDYSKHLLTAKHIKNMNEPQINPITNPITNNDVKLSCECGKKYNHYSSLWNHKQRCENKEKTNNIPMNLILEVIKQSKEIQNVLVEQNKELQAKLLEQSQQLLEQNKQIIERSDEHHKQIIELAKKPSMVNSNNQFNLNFFLNETCKNAMNIQDFIQSIKLTTQDFETTGRLGFVDGISRIFINELKRLEVERRPLHCTDMKRETVYVKDNDTWEKENQEKKKLKWAINSIAQLNLNQVQEWQQEYPECRENNTTANTRFNEMAMVALGGFGDEQETKFRDKIMKNVLREIVISKDI